MNEYFSYNFHLYTEKARWIPIVKCLHFKWWICNNFLSHSSTIWFSQEGSRLPGLLDTRACPGSPGKVTLAIEYELHNASRSAAQPRRRKWNGQCSYCIVLFWFQSVTVTVTSEYASVVGWTSVRKLWGQGVLLFCATIMVLSLHYLYWNAPSYREVSSTEVKALAYCAEDPRFETRFQLEGLGARPLSTQER